MNKTLFTGASGFIGSHFHEALDNSLIVNMDLKKPVFAQKAHFHEGDIRNIEHIRSIATPHNCDRILHLAAEHKDFGIPYEDYFRTNEQGTRNLCDIATELGIKKFVFYSSVAVYGSVADVADETTAPNPNMPYGASKLAGEHVLYEWAKADPTRSVLIIRPAVVYGERNVANMFRLIQQVQAGRYFHIGEGQNIKSIAYVKNLVAATLYLADKMQPGVQIFNYADEPQLRSREIGSIIAAALGRTEPITLPYWVVYTMGLPFDLAIKLTGKDLPISTNRVKKFCTQTYFKAQNVLNAGFAPKYTNKDGLQNMVKWMNSDNFKNEQFFDV